MNTGTSFQNCFKALTSNDPLHWQKRLFERMLAGTIPSACDLPTGLGKTSVIPIWLIALSSQDRSSSVGSLPRRLVYIVNRRTVVDQATEVVEQIRARLRNPSDDRWIEHKETLSALCRRSRVLSASGDEGDPFGVSTLRGELADNEEWKADPARPAIIIGTIDMIGSKLLFSGYGDGSYNRAHHAGLIGQDVLIVHDEAHLTPAFSDLLHGVADEQQRTPEPRPIQVMELSATRRNCDGEGDVLRLESEDEEDKIVTDRINATKLLTIHKIAEKDIITKLVELGRQHDKTPSKVLIYLRSPKHAQKVAEKLKKKRKDGADGRVALLTGTIRGYERDQLLQNPPTSPAGRIIRLFLDGAKPEHTVYLVSTSAGEVGIDLDADHMVCDLTTLDSMIQRLGRVNRSGGKGRKAHVDVVVATKKEKKGEKISEVERTVQATHRILKSWQRSSGTEINVSPLNLRKLMAKLSDDERTGAFSPVLSVPPLTDILLDAWSLTSIDNLPGRPEVAAYLHGLTHDLPETYVIWRKEVMILDNAKTDSEVLGNWFRSCRIETRERLRDRTDHVKEALAVLLESHRANNKDKSCDFPVIVLNERGDAKMWHLSEVVKKSFNLNYRTLVLPVEAGGLDEHGMLNEKHDVPAQDVDVADEENRRVRCLHIRTAYDKRYERVLTGEAFAKLPGGLREMERICLQQPSEGAEDEGESRDLVILAMPRELTLGNPETAKAQQTLDDHTHRIAYHAERITNSLRLDNSLKEAIVAAAKWHDRGKARSVWQRFANNPNGMNPLAKSDRYLHWRDLGGYRHEFGSMLEAVSDAKLKQHAKRELVLHLIAAHHGRARPHFDSKAFDTERSTQANEDAAVEVMRRFGQLQQRFGRWGLTWLESLVRCADIAASKEVVTKVEAELKDQRTHENA